MADQKQSGAGEPDPYAAARLGAFTGAVAAEAKLYRVVLDLLNKWATKVRTAVFGSSTEGRRTPDYQGIPHTQAWFSTEVDNAVDIEIREIFLDAADFEDPGMPDPSFRVRTYLADARNRLVGIPDRVYNDVRGAVLKATTEGWSIDDLESVIHKTLAESGAELWRSRARTIARTEAIGAMNAGRYAGFVSQAKQEGGSWDKIWLATHDHRTRPTHAHITGADLQRVPLTSPFKVGEAAMMYPGDPLGPPEEVCNCRCTLLLAREGEELDLTNRGYRGDA